MDINAHLVPLNLLIILALIGMTVALTRLTLELIALLIGSPLLLDETRTTLLTLITASIVRTTTDELIRPGRIGSITHLGMAIAHTTTANRNIPDTIEILHKQNKPL